MISAKDKIREHVMAGWKQCAFGLLFGIALASPAAADDDAIRIGILNDQSGPFADFAGPGSVVAAQLAIDDVGGKVNGKPVELLVADHQNKADVGSNIARKWFASGVDAIADVPNSSVALAVNFIAKEQNRVYLATTGVTTRLTGDACSPTTVQWAIDTWAMANGVAQGMADQGSKSWYFITADYAFGVEMERQVTEFVKAAGGSVAGSARHPINASDFSSFLLGAQGSGAKVLGLATSGADMVNLVKQAREFRIPESMKIASLALYITDVHALGLELAQGLYLTSAFYWDLNDRTRTFAKRFSDKFNGKKPSVFQAAVYSATLHYLKALQAGAPAKDGAAVVAKMKSMPTNDDAFGEGSIRRDGRKIHPMYAFQIKSPSESKGPWDYYRLVGTIPADKAWRPISSECEFAKKS
jgi:branched-chain amino acid transport system substrate-binding protein